MSAMNGHKIDDLPRVPTFTPRELEILERISKGMSNPQIAEDLTLALSTVKWYVRQIFNKLGV